MIHFIESDRNPSSRNVMNLSDYVMIEMLVEEDSGSFQRKKRSVETLRLLLVEDSPADAHVIQKHLNYGLDVPVILQHVESVAHAMAVLCRERFDLVLLDLNLPDSSGLETFHTVFRHSKDDPILVLSGAEDGELAVQAVRAGAQDYFPKAELTARSLGREVRFAMERSKRIRAERELVNTQEQIRIARRLQKGLYPHSAPVCPGFDIAGRAWAAEHACGDYFDFISMKDGRLGVVVGDVSGHGLGPALKMVESRAALRAHAQYEENLHQLICEVHKVFCGDHDIESRILFLTLFLGRLDVPGRVLEYSSAGHQGFHLSASGDVSELDSTDYAIGLVPEMSCDDVRRLQLESGDIVVVPTDGFAEAGARRRNMLGVDRMMDVVKSNKHLPADEIIKAMFAAAREHTRGQIQEDDMAAIVLKVI